MRSLAELSKTLGVLVALWAVLLAVGFAVDALPPDATSVAPEEEARPREADAGASAPEDAGIAELDAPTEPDAWEPPRDAGALAEIETFRVCVAGSEVGWAFGDLTGDGRPEIAIACDDHVEIIASTPPSFTRIARIAPPEPTPVRAIAIGDVDADARDDLVLALERGLYLVPRDASGGFGEPRVLAPGQNGALALGALDATRGLDVAVVHGRDPRAELWLYRGGPSPVRSRPSPAPLETTALAVADVDLDGHVDVVAVGAQQILFAFGDSTAAAARTSSFTPGGRAALTLDWDGDGVSEVLVERDEGACLIRPSPALRDEGVCLPEPTLPTALRAFELDRRPEGAGAILAIARANAEATPSVVRASAHDVSTVAVLATTRLGVHRVSAIDDGLVLLGSSVDPAGVRTIELARAPLGATIHDRAERSDVVDAPLVLSVSLPDSNAP